MSVNGIEIAVNQRWLTREGEKVTIVGNDGDATWPWDLSNGDCVSDNGKEFYEDTESSSDLITLIQDEHGFIPWNGGECPVGEGVEVEVKFRDEDSTEDFGDNFDWRNTGNGWNIIAYRVVDQEVEPTKADVEEEQTEQVDQPKEQKEIIKMKQKYTVKDVLYALDNLTDEYVDLTLEEQIEEYLAVRESADYKLYLELKAKFE